MQICFSRLKHFIMKTSRNRCWVKWAFRMRLGCLYRRYSGFYNLRILTIVIRYNLGLMCCLNKIIRRIRRILPWDPWLPICSMNLARSCQVSQDASKRVNPGSVSWLLNKFWHLCFGIERVISKIFQDSKQFFIQKDQRTCQNVSTSLNSGRLDCSLPCCSTFSQ